MPDVPLRDQLACARRELALRERVYPRLVANDTMRPAKAQHELAAMAAIARTLARLVAGEERWGQRQAELFGGTREAEG